VLLIKVVMCVKAVKNKQALVCGGMDSGVDVIDIGMVGTKKNYLR